MFKWPEKLTERDRRWFWFPNSLVKEGVWRGMAPSAKSIWPVLLSFRGRDGRAFPSQDTIGALAGRHRETVQEGTRALERMELLRMVHKRNPRGNRATEYHGIHAVPRERGSAFPFVQAVLTGGNWAVLTPSAQAAYIVLRTWGKIPIEALAEEADGDDYREAIACRDFDYWYPSRGEGYEPFAYDAGITVKSFRTALRDLARVCLIERDEEADEEGDEAWRVYLHPPRCFNRDDMEKQTAGLRK